MGKSTVLFKTAKDMAQFKAGGKNLAREHVHVLEGAQVEHDMLGRKPGGSDDDLDFGGGLPAALPQ